MNYCTAPVLFEHDADLNLRLSRPLHQAAHVIDNWMDTIIFTCIRRFKADEDFGFSFWDNEFITMNLIDFNNGNDYKIVHKPGNIEEKERISQAGIKLCEQSIRNSIRFYIPYLHDVSVKVQLSMEKDKLSRRGENSKYVVNVQIQGRTIYDEYADTREGNYRKEAVFFMDPFMNTK